MKLKNTIRTTSVASLFLLSLVFGTGCKKFLDVPLPTDKLAADGAYSTDNSAGAVITGIISNASSTIPYGGSESVGYRTSLYVDDFQNINPLSPINTAYTTNNVYYTNALTSAYSALWPILYKQLYYCNLAIEGITANQDKLVNKNQWLGEALFLRAFTYFDLVNLYGDIPFTTTSDYLTNNQLSRSPKTQVYTQMIADLKQAESLLGTVYLDGTGSTTVNRARPNQYVAAALLARVYLYNGDWPNAEAEATKVINNTSAYAMVAPAVAFLANSQETLWALVPMASNAPATVGDYGLYNSGMANSYPTQAPMAVFSMTPISQSLLNTFEPNDARVTNWLRITTTVTPAQSYYFPNKYKSNVAGTEFNIVLRLAEQYLIRSEARARQNNISGAATDLNVVRTRAGLGGTTAATQADMVNAVIKERRVELFSEYGHRFYDLKRTGTIDAVMTAAEAVKGGTWNSQAQIWPIPLSDILANPHLTQAPGYN
ncbi:MAG TPA: RagB/SusD family nutrient uptake outer membrane protein [Pedobacter sp.]